MLVNRVGLRTDQCREVAKCPAQSAVPDARANFERWLRCLEREAASAIPVEHDESRSREPRKTEPHLVERRNRAVKPVGTVHEFPELRRLGALSGVRERPEEPGIGPVEVWSQFGPCLVFANITRNCVALDDLSRERLILEAEVRIWTAA